MGLLKSKYFYSFIIAGFIAVLAVTQPGAVEVEPEKYLRQEGAEISRHGETGAVTFVGTKAGKAIDVPGAAQAKDPTDAAFVVMDAYGELFGIDDSKKQLRATRERVHKDGRATVRFQQVHDDVPVIAGDIVVNLDKQNRLLSLGGEASPSLALSTKAKLAADKAAEIATALVSKNYKLKGDALDASKPELSIYDARLLGPDELPAALAWKVEVTSGLSGRAVDKTAKDKRVPVREFVLVDATTGAVPLHFNQLDTAKNRETYNTFNTTNLPGTLVCNESNPNCTGGDDDQIKAHKFAGHTYDFFFTYHGRDSFNNAGATMLSTTHYDVVGYQNAFWNGTQVAYGDNFSDADDVVAHEWTHAFTENESNLFYWYQSGAINESLSDVWGEFVDQTNSDGNDTAGVKWLLGEDLAGGALRDMEDPTAYGDPDKLSSANYYEGAGDNGGVHYNSGVNNKAAYLMTDGGTFNGKTVTAMGITKVAKIYYEAQTNLLTSGSSYSDLYDGLYQACNNLVGTNGITSGDCAEVKDATDAVEMNQEPSPDFHPVATICPNGASPAGTLMFDDIEVNGDWYVTNISGTVDNWGYTTGYASSGVRSLYNADIPTAGDNAVYRGTGVNVTADTYLHFKHAFDFDTDGVNHFSGGFLEYSLNSGAWTDAGALFQAGKGYGGTVASGTGNTQAGRSAFVASSHGFVSSRYNLSNLSGNSLRFRFRISTDSSIQGPVGWSVDDVGIYSCDLTQPVTTLEATPGSPDGDGGWYKSAPSVSLSSNEGGVTQYQWDSTSDGGWNAYTTSLTPAQGTHALHYRSFDNYSNTEDVQSDVFKVDNVLPANPSLSSPSHTTASPSSDDTVQMDWGGASDGTSGLAGYSTSWDGQAVATPDTVADHAAGIGTETSPQLADGYRYFHLRAKDAAGNWSAPVHFGPVSIDTTAPAAPALSGVAAGSTAIDLDWPAASDGSGSGVFEYRIYNADNDGLLASTSDSAYSAAGLSANTTYRYYVKSIDGAGNTSAASNTVVVQTAAGDLIVPTTPVLSGFSPLAGRIDLYWTASTDNNGIDGYKVYDADGGGVLADIDTTSQSFTGLSGLVFYDYYVKAYDGDGNHSGASNTVRIKPGSGGNTPLGGVGEITTVVPDPSLSITFPDVTASGSTSMTQSGSPVAAPPAGYRFRGNQLNITTTATFVGSPTVSFKYNPSQISGPESQLRLFHYKNGSWTDITTSIDTANNVVMGETTSFSPFILGEPSLSSTGGESTRLLLGSTLCLLGLALFIQLRRKRIIDS